jgi:hypothetical protein
VKELLDLVDELGGVFLLTADHGNADDMVQRDKKVASHTLHTSHTSPHLTPDKPLTPHLSRLTSHLISHTYHISHLHLTLHLFTPFTPLTLLTPLTPLTPHIALHLSCTSRLAPHILHLRARR